MQKMRHQITIKKSTDTLLRISLPVGILCVILFMREQTFLDSYI